MQETPLKHIRDGVSSGHSFGVHALLRDLLIDMHTVTALTQLVLPHRLLTSGLVGFSSQASFSVFSASCAFSAK